MSEEAGVQLRFKRGQATGDELQETVNAALTDLRDPSSELAERARALGFEPADLANGQITVEEAEQGIEPILTTIVVGIAIHVAGHVVIEAWEKVFWPYVKKFRGGQALGESTSDPEEG